MVGDSGPLELKPPPALEGSGRAVSMMIVEWEQAGDPVEPTSEPRLFTR
jgi:hypothetical protein